MRILIEAHHPAHIHFWKYAIRELQDEGHTVLMIARDRDVMRRLLKAYDWIHAEIPKRRTRNNRFPLLEMLERQWTVARAIYRFKPNVVASLMGSYTQSAKLFGVRNIIFTDSEFQHFNHLIAHPFADEIHTPECFYKELGSKQKRYNGIHEMAFMSPDFFTANKKVLKSYGLEQLDYILVRLSAWNTLHDISHSGLAEESLRFLTDLGQKFQLVVVGEEAAVPEELKKDVISIQPEDFHHLLAFAAFVVTEGASTASEAACLGVPTVYINSTEPRGYLLMLERDYGLVHCFGEVSEGAAQTWVILATTHEKERAELKQAAHRFASDSTSVVHHVVAILEKEEPLAR